MTLNSYSMSHMRKIPFLQYSTVSWCFSPLHPSTVHHKILSLLSITTITSMESKTERCRKSKFFMALAINIFFLPILWHFPLHDTKIPSFLSSLDKGDTHEGVLSHLYRFEHETTK